MRIETFFMMLIFPSMLYILGWIFKANQSHQRFMKVLQLKAEMNQKLLDRAGTDPAMFELLKSEAQHQMFDVRIAEPPPQAPYMKMVNALQASFLLLTSGAACLWYGAQTPNQYGYAEGFKFFGALGVALGVGSLLAAAATFIVARMWNTLNRPA